MVPAPVHHHYNGGVQLRKPFVIISSLWSLPLIKIHSLFIFAQNQSDVNIWCFFFHNLVKWHPILKSRGNLQATSSWQSQQKNNSHPHFSFLEDILRDSELQLEECLLRDQGIPCAYSGVGCLEVTLNIALCDMVLGVTHAQFGVYHGPHFKPGSGTNPLPKSRSYINTLSLRVRSGAWPADHFQGWPASDSQWW